MSSSSNFAGHGFAQPPNVVSFLNKPNHYSLALEMENAYQMAELSVNMDAAGNIWAAKYSTGAEFRHNENYSVVKNANNQLWFGDRHGAFHPFD